MTEAVGMIVDFGHYIPFGPQEVKVILNAEDVLNPEVLICDAPILADGLLIQVACNEECTYLFAGFDISYILRQ